jgi:hypothetical protein
MIKNVQPEPVVHNSPALQALCQKLQNVDSCRVLELGPVRRQNIEFWSRFAPTIYVADLRSNLPLPASSSEDSELLEPDWSNLLGLPEGRKYDVILAWDLLNYMEIQAISSLIVYLEPFCRPGALLFMLIFDQREMPDQITTYQIVDESHLQYEYVGPEMRSCPRHQPRALAGVLSQFRVAGSFRLRNGVVEYLYESTR